MSIRQGNKIIANKTVPSVYTAGQGITIDHNVIAGKDATYDQKGIAKLATEEEIVLGVSESSVVNALQLNKAIDKEAKARLIADESIALTKLQDYLYMYESIASDMSYEEAIKYFEENFHNRENVLTATIPYGACSSIRNGNFYGRNYDWYYNTNTTFVVYDKAQKDKYEFLGVAQSVLDELDFDSEEVIKKIRLIPYLILDGVNEHSVFCNTNVVPTGDLDITTGTHADLEGDYICQVMLPKYVLDHFTNATDAVNWIRDEAKIFAPRNATTQLELHFMVGDPNHTYIVEFVHNEAVISEVTNSKQEVMTNFYRYGAIFDENGHVDFNSVTAYGSGLERYNILVDAYDSVNDIASMRQCIDLVEYTKAYSEIYTDPVAKIINPNTWKTEWAHDYSDSTVLPHPMDLHANSPLSDYEYSGIFDVLYYMYQNRSRETGTTWQTVHSSVYDIERKELYLKVQEGNKQYHFVYPTTPRILQNIDEEVERAKAAEAALGGDVAEEARIRAEEDERLEGLITEETSRATEAETNLQESIDTESQTRLDEDTRLEGLITTETERAETKEDELDAAIKAEEQARIDADTALSNRITQNTQDITNINNELDTYGDIVTHDIDEFATAEQGRKADSAVQNLADLGITATAQEINVLDGITASTTELNYVDGVTSNVQTQLNKKVEANAAITGATHTKITYDSKGLVTSGSDIVAADITDLTASATELNYVKGVTSGIQSQLDSKVDKTDAIKKVYGTDNAGNQTTLSYSNTANAGYIVQRDSNAQIIVPDTPVADENAASKKYVDDGLALKPDTNDLADVAYSGSYTDLINTPTYKTINSEAITGTGDISLQTKLSGTNGNIVTYTTTTGTLGELGFDNTPTQNSNKLVKSGPIWTELQKKVNITDIKNNLTSADTDKPLSAYQGKVLDEKITLVQQSTHDRGVVLNALTSQGRNYTITNAAINNAGTNYTVGDTLFLTSDLAIDAVINVISVSATGAITSIALGQGGAFTEQPAATGVEFVGGTGNGAKFNLTSVQVDNSTLASILNPQPNDFGTVLSDEIHNNLRYVWKYVDIDGDGHYEWVAGYPITNIERNFYEDPIKDGELGTNAVITSKIANNNVTGEKIADNAIISRHITEGTITDIHVANNAQIQQSKILNLEDDLNSKVDKTSTAYQLYGTAAANTETTITYATSNTASTIVQRTGDSQVNVALMPTENANATSKKYVDDQLNLKVDKTTNSKRVYGTDANGNQTTYDYDSFGKVDDVKAGDVSVVVNKIAALGTIVTEDKDDYIKVKTTPLVPATKTKITYDSNGVITAGADLTQADIPSLNLSKITDVTATAAEVNVLDGITVSTTELNYVDGTTGNIQNQLNSKQPTLISGTNIKTINNTTLLGSGNIAVQGVISDLETIRSNAAAGKAASNTIATYGDVVTHNTSDFATSKQGEKADTAIQPNDNISELTNDANYQTGTQVNSAISTHNSSTTAHNDIRQEVALKQNITDNTLTTTSKTIVGAINELDARPVAPAIDNKTISKNTSDQLQTVAVIDQANTSVGLKEWTGSDAAYQALSVKDNNTIYYTY